MRTDFERATRLGDVLHWAGEMSARTMIFDVEPLVAYWDGGQEALDQGVARVLSEVSVLPALQVLCFATNSSRRPSVVPSGAGPRVVYLASAGKPMRTAAYRGFPRPGMVIGDQVATDGILARRLGYAFVLYDPQLAEVPAGPRLMGAYGRLVRPLLFTRADDEN
jgi:predicted HAD superfamily phosphohydrolase YqeG